MITEKQKMLSGAPYLSADAELVGEREAASQLLFDLAGIPPARKVERYALLRQLLGSAGENFTIERNFHCDYGYNIYLGENFYANVNCTILDCAEVRIGDNVLLAPNVGIYTAGHPLQVESRIAGVEFAYPVTIGNNVWIGGNSILLPGVTIGDNTVIGAGSVVTRSIPANVVAVGNPCRVVRSLV